jgi:hypothetical protein
LPCFLEVTGYMFRLPKSHNHASNIHLKCYILALLLLVFSLWAGFGRNQSSGTLHYGQILRSSLPLLSPAFRRSHFCRQMSPRPQSASASSSERWNYGREWSGNFAEMTPYSTPFRDLLNAESLRHGANGFTSLPKEGMLRIFSPEKSDGFGRERTRDLGYQRPAC